jgi:hypothetical protein
MAITPTYSWPLPDDTSLVKDGAEAIRDLGNAIDTTVGGLPGAGLVHINTTTVTGVTSVALNNVFSATYDNYMITYEMTSTASQGVDFRLRLGTTDASGSNYAYQQIEVGGTSLTGLRATGLSAGRFAATRTTGRTAGYWYLFNPFQTLATSSISTNHDPSATLIILDFRSNHSLGNSYDGINILAGTAINGTFRVYGLAQ